jgi:hypothetical protein
MSGFGVCSGRDNFDTICQLHHFADILAEKFEELVRIDRKSENNLVLEEGNGYWVLDLRYWVIRK